MAGEWQRSRFRWPSKLKSVVLQSTSDANGKTGYRAFWSLVQNVLSAMPPTLTSITFTPGVSKKNRAPESVLKYLDRDAFQSAFGKFTQLRELNVDIPGRSRGNQSVLDRCEILKRDLISLVGHPGLIVNIQ